MNKITKRSETPQDEAFLFELYATTRQEELEAWGWPMDMRKSFLEIQFRASRGYDSAFPGADFQIILVDGANAGRMVIDRTQKDLLVVDLALLPQYRNAGIGTALVQEVCSEAATIQKPVRLQVSKGNRARRWYERLGFIPTFETEIHVHMEWRAPVPTMPMPSGRIP